VGDGLQVLVKLDLFLDFLLEGVYNSIVGWLLLERKGEDLLEDGPQVLWNQGEDLLSILDL